MAKWHSKFTKNRIVLVYVHVFISKYQHKLYAKIMSDVWEVAACWNVFLMSLFVFNY